MNAFVWRMVGALVPLLVALFNVRNEIRSWKNRWVSAERRVGPLGRVYRWVWKIPHKLLLILIVVVMVLAAIALVTGTTMLTVGGSDPLNHPTPKLQQWRSNTFWNLVESLFGFSQWLAIAYVIIALLVHFNLLVHLSRNFIRVIALAKPEIAYSPGYCNAMWQLRDVNEFTPVNVNWEGIKRLAEACAGQIARDDEDWLMDRAVKREGLDLDEYANVALIGNIIEGGIHRSASISRVLPDTGVRKDWSVPDSWREFYDRLQQVAITKDRPFAPAKICEYASTKVSFYDMLRDHVGELLPDEFAIGEAVEGALRRLSNDFSGNARNLALRGEFTVSRKPSLHLARRRAEKVMAFDGHHHVGVQVSHTLVGQFVKIAYRWGVWESADSAPLLFPPDRYIGENRRLTAMLFNTECLVAPSEVKAVPYDIYLKRLLVWTVHQIANAVDKQLDSATNKKAAEKYHGLVGSSPNSARKWHSYEIIDTLLWGLTKQTSGGVLGGSIWRVRGNEVVRSN